MAKDHKRPLRQMPPCRSWRASHRGRHGTRAVRGSAADSDLRDSDPVPPGAAAVSACALTAHGRGHRPPQPETHVVTVTVDSESETHRTAVLKLGPWP